jgi:cystathionine beta-lyase/cystathionine gamma-synthase
VSATFSAEARLIHAGTARTPDQPAAPAPDGLIRLSVGIEPAADLIAGIGQVLAAAEVP